LPEFLAPLYKILIEAVHPVLIPIIDAFSVRLTSVERRRLIEQREKKRYTFRPHVDQDRVRKYTRSIPPRWRPKLLEKYGFKCAICQTELRANSVHIDHLVPFSRGGMTVFENLQPTCVKCNLAKGNRPSASRKAPKPPRTDY
jgi:5-methylcytosine-specific restriction endonuclease McrA